MWALLYLIASFSSATLCQHNKEIAKLLMGTVWLQALKYCILSTADHLKFLHDTPAQLVL